MTIPVIAEEIGAPALLQLGGGVRSPLLPGNLAAEGAAALLTGILMVSTQAPGACRKAFDAASLIAAGHTDEPSSANGLHHGRPARGTAPRAQGRSRCLGAKVSCSTGSALVRRVLSVGCGPGVILRFGRPIWIIHQGNWNHISRERLQQARERNRDNSRVQFCLRQCAGDGVSVQQFRPGLLPYVAPIPEGKGKAVSDMARVLQARRHVLLQDLDGQLLWHYPEDPPVPANA